MIQESSETSGVGGRSNSAASAGGALRIGDAADDAQLLLITSFDTSPIPDGVIITDATLRLRRGQLSGSSPFATHGTAQVDISNGGFGGDPALAPSDFEAVATATAVATLSEAAANGDWSEATLNAAGLAAINRSGTTQLRAYFTLDDDDDGIRDYVGYYPGDALDAADQPELVVTYVTGNAPPTVSITSPADGAEFAVGAGVDFAGTAIDFEDGDLTASLTWVSDIDGAIGTGGSFSTTTLSQSTHYITAQATDLDGDTGMASITITVGNLAPTVTITSPVDGLVVDEGTLIDFAGAANDFEDGDLSASLSWSSDIDGVIGAGAGFSLDTLSAGTHLITALVTDSGGRSDSASINVTVTGNTPPTVTITAPADGSSFTAGSSISFAGTASDAEDGDLTASLNWVSDIDGAIGSGGSFSAGLSDGTHLITADVTDSGSLLGSDSITVTVSAASTTTFTNIAVAAGLVTSDARGIAFGDYNNDGCVDVAFSGSPRSGSLWENDCTGNFTDVSVATNFGTAASAAAGEGIAWADYDADGDLDAYIALRGAAPNELWRNDGGTFTEVAAAVGVDDVRFGAGVAWTDYDGDGDLDLHVVNRWGTGDRSDALYQNNGGIFTDVGVAAGIAGATDRLSFQGAWVDFDENFTQDLYLAVDFNDDVYYTNDGLGNMTDASTAAGVSDPGHGMGVAVGDPTGDGCLDVFITNSALPQQLRRHLHPDRRRGRHPGPRHGRVGYQLRRLRQRRRRGPVDCGGRDAELG
jgi:hypothetical protein